MLNWPVVLLVVLCIPNVQTQTWPGIYQSNSECDLSSCCCPTSELYITEVTENKLSLNVSLTGENCMGLTYLQQDDIDKPTDYTLSMFLFIIQLQATLSENSDTITVTSSFGDQCTVIAIRIDGTTTITSTSTTTTTTTTKKRTTRKRRTTTRRYNRALEMHGNNLMLFGIIFIYFSI